MMQIAQIAPPQKDGWARCRKWPGNLRHLRHLRIDARNVERIIEQEKPAHTSYQFELRAPR